MDMKNSIRWAALKRKRATGCDDEVEGDQQQSSLTPAQKVELVQWSLIAKQDSQQNHIAIEGISNARVENCCLQSL